MIVFSYFEVLLLRSASQATIYIFYFILRKNCIRFRIQLRGVRKTARQRQLIPAERIFNIHIFYGNRYPRKKYNSRIREVGGGRGFEFRFRTSRDSRERPPRTFPVRTNARSRGHVPILRICSPRARRGFACIRNSVSHIGNYSRYTILHAPLVHAGPFIFTLAPPRE